MLSRIKELARTGRIEFWHHAERKQATRGVTTSDILEAISNAKSAVRQRREKSKERYRVRGKDLTDRPLVVIVEVRDDLIVVTIFREDDDL